MGPTASGKTSLGITLCHALQGEIVNCDSIQMVKGMDIGTAKPTLDERKEVPHHLFDIIEPDQSFSAGQYARVAREVCFAIRGRQRVPVVVGGTGLYLRSLLEGIFRGPGRSPELRRRLRTIAGKRGWDYLYRWLQKADPERARQLHPSDHIRIIRALEVYLKSGEKISRLRKKRRPLEGFNVIKLGLNPDRTKLYERINARVEEMFSSGLLEEVRALLQSGYSPDCKGFEALGYRYAVAVLQGEMTRPEAIRLTQRDTRRYAKRQLTWFKKEPEVEWIRNWGWEEEARQQALDVAARYDGDTRDGV